MMNFESESWRAQAESWVGRQLERRGVGRPFRTIVHHQRPWSLVLRVSTGSENYYMKAVRAGFEYEVRITSSLAKRWPDLSPQVIATDGERGWMLLADGGATLRSAAADGEIVDHWHRLLPAYARLQQDLGDEAEWLLAQGVPDRRPMALSQQVRELAGDPMILSEGSPSGLQPAERKAWDNLLGRLPSMCAELAEAGVPASLNHGDLHDANVFLQGGRYRIFDWGDCSLTHPFFSIRTVSVSLENRLGWQEDDPRFGPLVDAYVQAWSSLVEPVALQRAFKLASGLWAAGSLLSWWDALRALSPPERQPYEHVLPSLARELIMAADGPR